MKQIILGTAGHIDHGKTSLIKALTGVNTDRLKEEQLRGITIELGFTSLSLPSGFNLGIVDVPGHEKFVKNMVAGATGIDILVMVIAADEGVMPQTKEHIEICSMLNIKHGIVALTKIDTVDEEWLELAKEDISEFTNETFLEDAPIIPISSLTGQGLKNFITTLDNICSKVKIRSSSGIFRLPVDRTFTMKGFGTVITGTLISGKIKVNDSVTIYPTQTHSKIRGIQVHNQNTKFAKAGIRTAINLQGLEKNLVSRGNVVSMENTLHNSHLLDLLVFFLKSNKKPAKNRTKLRFHTGTSEVLGNLILLDRDELSPGEKCTAQIRLEAPLALVRGDRFVIRSYSPIRTVGGGEVLNPIPEKHKRFNKETLNNLKILTNGTSDEILEYQIKAAGATGISFDKLMITTGLSVKNLNYKIEKVLSEKKIVKIEKKPRVYIHSSTFKMLVKQTMKILKVYHSKYPIKTGMPKEELKSQLPFNINTKIFLVIFNWMTSNHKISIEKELVKLTTHTVTLKINQEKIKTQIIEIYRKNQLMPPYFREVVKNLNIKTTEAKLVLNLLVNENTLVKIKEELYYHKNALDKLEKKLTNFLIANKEITTTQFKSITKASRKYSIPLIEYFDSSKLTIRIGNIRKLRKKI